MDGGVRLVPVACMDSEIGSHAVRHSSVTRVNPNLSWCEMICLRIDCNMEPELMELPKLQMATTRHESILWSVRTYRYATPERSVVAGPEILGYASVVHRYFC